MSVINELMKKMLMQY